MAQGMHKVVCYFVTARVLESVYSFTVNFVWLCSNILCCNVRDR